MVDQIRIMIMRLWELIRTIGDVLQGDKLRVHHVVKRSQNLAHLTIEKPSLYGGEVRDTKTTRRHVVDTESHVSIPYFSCPPNKSKICTHIYMNITE
jgi:hypothetical protein